MSLFEELFWWLCRVLCGITGHDLHMITADHRGEVCIRCGRTF